MGLDGEIKKRVRDVWAVGCFTSGMRRPNTSHVSIVDYLTKFMCIPGRDAADSITHTLDQMGKYLTREIRDPVCVVICDYRARVPKLKRNTQNKRIASHAKATADKGLAPAVPYPSDAAFDTAGGCVTWTEDDGTVVMEDLCLRRLAMSRWFGAPDDPARHSNLGSQVALWATMHGAIQAFVAQSLFTRHVIFDYDDGGAWNFRKDASGPTRDTDNPHELGEADTAMAYWYRKFDGTTDNIHLHTNDGDQMAIYAMYHDSRTPAQLAKTRIWWHCEKGVAVDLCKMVTLMLEKPFALPDGRTVHFPSGRAIGLFFLMCHSDFVDERVYSFGVNVDDMLIAFLAIDWKRMNTLAHGPNQTAFLEHWLVLLHQRKLPGGKTLVPADHRKVVPMVSIERIRERYREKEVVSLATLVAKHAKEQKEFYDQTTRELAAMGAALMDQDSCQVAVARRKAASADLDAKQQAQLANRWLFPSAAELDWAAAVIQWNFSYWQMAPQGIAPPEPVRGEMA